MNGMDSMSMSMSANLCESSSESEGFESEGGLK